MTSSDATAAYSPMVQLFDVMTFDGIRLVVYYVYMKSNTEFTLWHALLVTVVWLSSCT